MERQKTLIDASIIVKWFTEEENTEKAIQLQKEHIQRTRILVIPKLAYLEVLNTLRYKKRDKETLQQVNEALEELNFEIEPITKEHREKTIELALKLNLTIYDALYLTLAQYLNIPLITADKKLATLPESITLEKLYP
ncbi:MAG TPA: type II toxin-antitoxin system VapC family toxin [Candidatus Nanoarchaeia archaeon]|nr:type II toxin-antitoxin system VapC family toxin [Candidatus Nanoarchaeia archaeon]